MLTIKNIKYRIDLEKFVDEKDLWGMDFKERMLI